MRTFNKLEEGINPQAATTQKAVNEAEENPVTPYRAPEQGSQPQPSPQQPLVNFDTDDLEDDDDENLFPQNK